MIDIHCHLLPNIDDGAASEEIALEMAAQAVSEGIHTVIATPHHSNGKYHTPRETIHSAVASVNRLFERHNIALEVFSGQEVRLTRSTLEEMEKGELQTLGNSKYLLVELPSMEVPRFTDELLYEIRVAGWKPVLAHPERNAELVANPQKLLEWVQEGLYTQVTSHSLTGMFGKKLQQFSLSLFKNGLAHLVASDAHEPRNRNIALNQAYHHLVAGIGQSFADSIKYNAEAILANDRLETVEPAWKMKKWYQWW